MTKCHFEREVARSALKPDIAKIKHRDTLPNKTRLNVLFYERKQRSCASPGKLTIK